MSEYKIKKTGYLWKQGGSYRNWKKRYFVLRGNSLEYYKNEEDSSPKGTIDLTTGRGVRTREQCDLEWPDKAKLGRCFGIALETRTFYIYGEDIVAIRDWMTTIQDIINKVGHPTNDYCSDVQPVHQENKMSRAMKNGLKAMSKMAHRLSKHSGSDTDEAGSNAGSGSDIEEIYGEVDDNPTPAYDLYINVEKSPRHDEESAILRQNTVIVKSDVYENVEMAAVKRHDSELEIEEIYADVENADDIYDDVSTVNTQSSSGTVLAEQPAEGTKFSDSENLQRLLFSSTFGSANEGMTSL